MDEVRLEFEDDALMAIAKQAKRKKVGARHSVKHHRGFYVDIMYEIPKDDNIKSGDHYKEYGEKGGSAHYHEAVHRFVAVE